MLAWSQDQLAEAAKVAKATIANFEAGKRDPYDRTLLDLKRAVEAAGVEFTNGDQPGVRWRPWKWSIEIKDAKSGRSRLVALYPDFESTLAAAKDLLKGDKKPDEQPWVNVPAEATEAQRTSLIALGLSSVWT
jgi:transcriptional regulator with XRE-family HTH domain